MTVLMGLVSEEDCFRAIEDLGNNKFALKHILAEGLQKNSFTQEKLAEITRSLDQVHQIQLAIINDVSMRFKVIHPKLSVVTEEMKRENETYWDWYKRLYKKVHGSTPDTSQLEAQF